MTTYSAEVNIYNPEAIADAVEEAGETAGTYITEINNDGIMVHAEGEGPNDTQTPSGWHLSNVLEYIRQGISRFWIGLKNQGDTTPTVRIGKDTGESKMELDYHSLQLIDKEGDTYFHVSDLRGTDGEAVFTDTWTADGSTKYFDLTNWADDTNYDVLIDGVVVTEGVSKYNAQVVINPAPANGAVVSATYTSTSDIAKAYSIGPRGEGNVGASSISIGRLNVVEGMHSAAIGRHNTVNGWDSVAIGYWNEIDTSGFGYAIGRELQVEGSDQLVIGANNVPHGPNLYGRSPLFIIGNGELDTDRSNAFMVDWDGYIYPMDEKMADWVTAQGTSGIWTYRKWHSGIAECWGNYTASIAVNNSSAGYGGYRSGQLTLNLPSGLFAAWPTTTATTASSQGVWVNNVADTSASSIKFFLSSGSSLSAASRTVCFRCSGRWK